MEATINEVSGNVAEVVLNDAKWNAAVTCNVELDEGDFYCILDAWIELANDYKAKVDPGYLLPDARPYINDALTAYYADLEDDNKVREQEGNE